MSNKTVKATGSTFRGSVAAGMGSLFNPGGKKYYILEHKVSSKYHRQGEAQEIIVDTIELGRDSHCQVRFDDRFNTVSRRHAAIVKDGDGWKLVQLSETNSTFLNGKRIDHEWYLQNGDEIQLSVNGPKLGFIIPTGAKATVGSIGLTRRMSLFRQQALRPYKNAIAALALILVLAVGGLTTWNVLMQKDFDKQIALAKEKLENYKAENSQLMDSLEAENAKEQARQDSIINVLKKRRTTVIYNGGDKQISSNIDKVQNDIFFLRTTKVIVTDGEDEEEIPNYGWYGTGFLTSDGRFITAKHCVNGWLFARNGGMPTGENADKILAYLMYGMSTPGWKIVAYFEARSKSKVLRFKSTDFVMSHNTERVVKLGDGIKWKEETSMAADWAYVQTGQKGSIVVDEEMAEHLPVGADLHVLGFPHGWGAIDTYNFSCLYGSCKTSREGLDDGIIRVSARNYESGNSGGPVFYNVKGQLRAVGIVSYGQGQHNGGLCSVSNLHR